jgi:repressor LexA
MDMVRRLIADRLAELGLQMKDVSLRIGRNDTYLHQYMKRGVPVELKETDRKRLADILKLHEDQLRGPSATLPKRSYAKNGTVPARV